MKTFLKNIILFLIPITLVLCSGLILPPTPRASKSLLFAIKQKDSLLIHTKSPRIIFVGGSNLSFGLNSRKIKHSLNLNPINTAIHAALGTRFMLENTLQYVKTGDIIILAFEYGHYYKSYNHTSDQLLRTIADVSPDKIKHLSLKQAINLIQYIPNFSFTKFKTSEYKGYQVSSIYSINSFNKFGDVETHWKMKNRGYRPTRVKGTFNKTIVRKIKEFENTAVERGAKVYITFPAYDEISFKNSKDKILKVEKTLNEHEFNVLGNAKRYSMPVEMMFNTSYHLNKKGVEHRTNLFIEDYIKAQRKESKKE